MRTTSTAHRGLAFFSILLLAAVPAPAAAAAHPLDVHLVALCLPQERVCGELPPACDGLARLGGRVAVEVRATRGGAPAAYERVRLDPLGLTAMTDADGLARFSIPPRVGSLQIAVSAGDDAAGAVATAQVAWTQVVVFLEHAPEAALRAGGASFALRLLDAVTGAPLESGVAIVEGADGRRASTGPVDREGRGVAVVEFGGEAQEAIRVVDADACGLTLGSVPAEHTLRWHTTAAGVDPPSLSLRAAPGWVATNLVAHDVVGGEPPVRVEWREGGGAWRAAPIVLHDGEHRIEARAVDVHGRLSPTVATTARVDTAPPILDAALGTRGWSRCEGFSWTARDASSGIPPGEVSLVLGGRGVPIARVGDRFSATLPEGKWTGELQAVDAAGNVARIPLDLSCDRTAPQAAPTWMPGSWVRCEDVAWRFTEVASGIAEAVVDGPTVAARARVSDDRVLFAASEGIGPVSLTLRDGAGNAATSQAELRCDAHAPTVVAEPRAALVEGHVAAPDGIVARANDSGSGVSSVRARVGEGPWLAPEMLRLEGEGTRRVEVEAVDEVGRRTHASFDFAVDTLPPRVGAPATVEAGGTLALDVVENGSGLARVTIRAGEGAALASLAPGERSLELPRDLPAGTTVVVEAADRVGNVEAVRVLVVAPPAPERQAPVAPPPPPPSGPDAREPEEDDAPAPVAYRLQAVVVTPARGPVTEPVRVSGVAEGVETGEAFLVDANGTFHRLGPVVFDGASFVAAGAAPAPGRYDVRLNFTTPDAGRVSHAAGSVVVAPPPPPPTPAEPVSGANVDPAPTPGAGVAALVVAAAAAAAFAPRRASRKP